MPKHHGGYHQVLLQPKCLAKYAAQAGQFLAQRGIQAIAVRGASGMVMGGAISAQTGIPLIVVRRDAEVNDSHSSTQVETYDGTYEPYERWAIVDDVIASGATMRKIIEAVGRTTGVITTERPEVIVLYRNTNNHTSWGDHTSWGAIPVVTVGRTTYDCDGGAIDD